MSLLPAKSEAMRVGFIAGASRSGSTLLGSLLGEIDGVTSVGELSQLWSRGLCDGEPCGCGVSVHSCPFWVSVLRAAFPMERPSTETVLRARTRIISSRDWLRSRFFIGYRDEIREPLDTYRLLAGSLYSAIADVGDSRVVVDSSKFITHILPLTGLDEFDIRIVHLVRDSRAVAYSLQRSRYRPQGGDRSVPMNTEPPLSAASHWLKINALTSTLGHLHGRYRRVRYEDLIHDPRTELMKICAFLGIGPTVLPLAAPDIGCLRVQHSISGNPSRFTVGQVPLRLDDEWRREMNPADRRTVLGRTWPLMAAYGYLGPS
jgi:sulfotransferase family protein